MVTQLTKIAHASSSSFCILWAGNGHRGKAETATSETWGFLHLTEPWRKRETDRDGETERETEKESETETEIETYRETWKDRDRERHTERQKDIERDRQRQADRDRDRERYSEELSRASSSTEAEALFNSSSAAGEVIGHWLPGKIACKSQDPEFPPKYHRAYLQGGAIPGEWLLPTLVRVAAPNSYMLLKPHLYLAPGWSWAFCSQDPLVLAFGRRVWTCPSPHAVSFAMRRNVICLSCLSTYHCSTKAYFIPTPFI